VTLMVLKEEGGLAPLNIAGGVIPPGMRTISCERHFGHTRFFMGLIAFQ
jgi:hypothetical protein